nr:sodium leak channel non-selective protein [Ciona intestinalis]|eukprot:XP_009858187.2 sodium leak channel non-selective protein [Ciona intestinalis]
MEKTHSVLWIYKQRARRVFVLCVILSFLSVSSNTPATFRRFPQLQIITIIVDIVTGFILSIEVIVKIRNHGMFKGENPCGTSRWFIFDCVMVIFIWLSIILQALEIAGGQVVVGTPVGLLRVPRALIMLRAFRHCFSFQFESGRIGIIVVRASHQIGGVTLFLLFFLLLYGLLGVQLFGTMSHHCVVNNTDPTNITLSNLAIPDTHCSPEDKFMCPDGFNCMELQLSIIQRGFSGFDNIFISIKTVYEAASQEGWVFLMYKNIDSYQDWHGYLYFVTLIFFLAWLVKNVFIAVIIETMAEIRVQLHNLWGNSKCSHTTYATQRITSEGSSTNWALVDFDMKKSHPKTIDAWRQALRSRWFHLMMLIVIVLNVCISAVQPRMDKRVWNFYSIAELFFTVIFDMELIIKVITLGPRGYFKRNIYKYEAFLALVTTFNTACSYDVIRSVPVLRIIRLVKLSPTLENFLYKIFGPAKKIGLLVVFTLSILTFMSTISLQMLCHVEHLYSFATFPEAFKSMFQIMTQEGWIDVMHEVMKLVSDSTRIPVSIYFILYHLFVTTVVISLFVAVILDNLELDENLKRLKQLKVSEQSVELQQPFRLRIFERFPNRPEMVRLSKMPNEFLLPRLRDSFMRQFVDTRSPIAHSVAASHSTGLPLSAYANFSTSSAIVASTVLATRVAVQEDGLPNSIKFHQEQDVVLNPEIRNGFPYRDRLLWKRMKNNQDLALVPHSSKKKPSLMCNHRINEVKPNMLDFLMRDCAQQRISKESSGLTSSAVGTSKSLLGAQHLIRRERRPFFPNRRTFNDENRLTTVDNNIRASESLYDHNAQQEVDIKLIHLKCQQALLKRQRHEQELRENHPLFDTPLLFIKRDSQFRKICKYIVTAQYGKSENSSENVKEQGNSQVLHDLLGLVPYLDWFMILVTVTSCCSMLMEKTTMRIHDTPALQVAEYIFVVSMGCELTLKVIANGVFFTPKPAFKDLGGFLDAAIFIVSVVFLCTLSGSHTGQFLMILRCFRPLRIFKLVPQIRKVVIELFRSFKEITMVFILLVALIFVFASFGVQMYGGQLAACNDLTITKKSDCHGIFFQTVWLSNNLNIEEDPPGFMVPRVWTNPRNFNFDTIGSATLALFEVLSLKGWIEVRDILVERMGPLHAIYIHLFVFLGCMMGLTLFIGVVIANYNENKGTALLTVDQRRWEDLKSRLKIAQPLHLPPRPPGNGIRAKMYDLSEHHRFKAAIACCVMVRSLLLSIKWTSSNPHARYPLYASIVFTFIFLLEMIIKVIGLTFIGTISSWRNRYDMVVTICDVGWVMMWFILPGQNAYVYNIGWVLVGLRFFSICGKHATLKMLLTTVAVSVYRSFFIILAMFLLLLCYAYAGVVLFGTVKYGENIDRHANFATAPLAVTVLFRIVTGEDWNKIMHDCMIQPPRCTPHHNYWETDCGNKTAALVYFCSFYVIIAYIMLNLLVAIIVENFSLFYTMDEDILLSYNDLHMFQVTWNTVDVKRKGAIDVKDVESVLRLLKGRLHIDQYRDRLLLKHMCYEMERAGRRSNTGNRSNGWTANGQTLRGRNVEEALYVTFHDVLMMCAYRSVDIRKSLQLEELLMREKLESEIEEEVAKRTIRKWLERCIRSRAKQRTMLNDSFIDNKMSANSVVTSQANDPAKIPSVETPGDVNVDSDDADGVFDVSNQKYLKGGKHRRTGLWKPPPSFVPGGPTTTKLPSLMVDGSSLSDEGTDGSSYEDKSSSKSLSTEFDQWWDRFDND